MSSITDISNSDEPLNIDTVPTSNIDRSDKYKHNPQSAAAAAPNAVPRPDKLEADLPAYPRVEPEDTTGAALNDVPRLLHA